MALSNRSAAESRSEDGRPASRADSALSPVANHAAAGHLWAELAHVLPGSAGEPLDRSTRAVMESALGTELAGVRIHADASASDAARRMDARAFTLGQDIYFGAGDPGTDRRLLAHELAHVVQNRAEPSYGPQRAPLPGKAGAVADPAEAEAEATAERIDPDLTGRRSEATAVSAPDDEQAELIQQAGWRASGVMPVTLSRTEPTNLVVPADASYEEIAARIGRPDAAGRTDWFETAPDTTREESDRRTVHVREPALVSTQLSGRVRVELDAQLSGDVDSCVAMLKAPRLDPTVASGLIWRALRWGDRAGWRTAGGKSYFDDYLDRLQAVSLVQPHWYTFGLTSSSARTALDILLEDSGSAAWMLRRTIRMRAGRVIEGTEDMYTGANLAPMSPLGHTWAHGVPASVLVRQLLATATSMPDALLSARNSAYLGLRVVVPSAEGVFYIYAAWAPTDPAGGQQYVFDFPGVAAVHPDSFSDVQPIGGEKERHTRASLLLDALPAAQDDPKAIMGLDYDVLREADHASRVEILRIALGPGLKTAGAHALLARFISTTSAQDFPEVERQLLKPETLRTLAWSSGSGRALLGRAYTLKALELRPLGVIALDDLPEFSRGSEGSTQWWVNVEAAEAESRAIPQAEWDPTTATELGHEPAVPGQPAGPMRQTGLTFQQNEFVTPWYGFGSGNTQGPKSGPYHPSQLLQLRMRGADETITVTAFELAMLGPVTEPWMEIGLPGLMKIANLWMMYAGARSFIGGMATAAAITRAGAAGAGDAALQRVGAELAKKTLYRFLFDVVVLGGSTAINAYRDQLNKTPAGRALVQITDIAFVGLAARDVYRLFSSGVLGRIVATAGQAIRELGATAPQRLLETYDTFRAFLSTLGKFVSKGLVRISETTTGVRMPTPVDGVAFSTAFRIARAELAGQRVLGGLSAAGRPTAAAEELLGRLGTLARDNEPFAKAYAAIARQAARLAPGEVNLFLARVQKVLNQRAHLADKIGGLLVDAMRAEDKIVALGEAERLLDPRSVLSDEAVIVLAAKAGRGRLDVRWFNELNLDPKYLDFIARDPNASWRLLRLAAERPLDRSLQAAAEKMLRGYAGEFLAQARIAKLMPGYVPQRQKGVIGTVLDFLLEEPGRLGRVRGLEVKAWRKDIWDAIASGLKKRAGTPMTDLESLGLDMLDSLTRQLSSGQAATKAQPLLMVSDQVSQTTINAMLRYFAKVTPGLRPQFLQFSEAELNTVINELRTGLLEGL